MFQLQNNFNIILKISYKKHHIKRKILNTLQNNVILDYVIHVS